MRHARLQDLVAELDRRRSTDVVGYHETMESYECVDLLVVDDFATTPVGTQAAIDLFEICEARDQRCAAVMASRPAPDEWHPRTGGELMADSKPDRLATGGDACRHGGPEREGVSRQEARGGGLVATNRSHRRYRARRARYRRVRSVGTAAP